MTDPTCGACEKPATRTWQRYASQEEHEIARLDWNNLAVGPTETSSLVAVLACEDHAIDEDLAVRTHDATCTAPRPDHVQRVGVEDNVNVQIRPGCDCSAAIGTRS
jgi:hypothetical protein